MSRWLALLTGIASVRAQDIQPDFNVLHGRAEFEQADRMLTAHIGRLLKAQSDRREALVIAARTPADIARYQAETRAIVERSLASQPTRTPLNPRVTGTLDRGSYIIEKIIFESRPGAYITANAFVPRNRRPPFPAIVVTIGHWGQGKAHEDHQRMAAYMARRGFLVLTYDVPGQGERIDHYNPIFHRTIIDRGSSEYFVTTEHGYAAAHAILAKGSFIHYLLWDGSRAIDYLASRPDVDPNRIAAAGTSGGGWLTEALAAWDRRVKVAVPVCYGGCAADQFMSEVGSLDMEALIAPRPMLLIGATGDTRDNVAGKIHKRDLIAPFYAAHNASDKLKFMLAESRHGFTDSMYPVAFEFLSRFLNPPPVPEPMPLGPPESEADLAATLTGQLNSSLGGDTTFKLARKDGAASTVPHPKLTAATIAAKLAIDVTQPALSKSEVLYKTSKPTYSLEKVVYRTDPDIYVPGILFLPAKPGPTPAIVFINETGKTADQIVDRYFRPLLDQGVAVFSIDPRGMGETSPASQAGGDYRSILMDQENSAFYNAMHLGKTLIGMRVHDVRGALEYLQSRPEIDRTKISVAGIGSGGIIALYAAAIDSRFHAITSINALASYASFADTEIYTMKPSVLIPSAFASFDLPDVAASIAPRRTAIVNPVDGANRPIGRPALRVESAAEIVKLLAAMN